MPISGRYDVIASKAGFADTAAKDIALIGDATAEITLQLNLQPGQTQVTVTGVMGEVRADQPQLGDILSALQIENTPLLNRRITFLPLLNAANRPAINQGDVFMNEDLFTTNGAGRRQTWFEVDGANGNDSWGRQTTFTHIASGGRAGNDGPDQCAFRPSTAAAPAAWSTSSPRAAASSSMAKRLELWRPSATAAALSGFNADQCDASGNDVTNDTLGQTALALSGPLGEVRTSPGR